MQLENLELTSSIEILHQRNILCFTPSTCLWVTSLINLLLIPSWKWSLTLKWNTSEKPSEKLSKRVAYRICRVATVRRKKKLFPQNSLPDSLPAEWVWKVYILFQCQLWNREFYFRFTFYLTWTWYSPLSTQSLAKTSRSKHSLHSDNEYLFEWFLLFHVQLLTFSSLL